MTSSIQGNIVVPPPAPPQPPAVPSHKIPVTTTMAQAVSPVPAEPATSSKEERKKSSNPGVVQSSKDSPPSVKLNNTDGENPGAAVSPTIDVKTSL